ncbi:MAG: phosphoethanolamine transferase CptA [Candidatus Accumulibacter sp.]|jgi:heptose-I-phosphate ethanolaminephosphotransferase|nr:phosphoethanolamine transferase CptA [Accumulibacter sp.]
MRFSLKSVERSRKRIDWAGLGWLYLFFWYFSGIHQTLLVPMAGFTGLRDAFLLSFIWLAPVLLFPRWTRQISAFIGVVLWAASLVNLSYLAIYGQEFSKSVFFTLFETNLEESQEYLEAYLDLRLILGLAVYTLLAWLLWRRLRPVTLPRFPAVAVSLLLVLPNLGYPYIGYMKGRTSFRYATLKLQARLEPAVPWQLLMGYAYYRHQADVIEELLRENSALPPLQNLVDLNGDTPRTLVLVIGESTTSRRMSLYGYPRKTTPRLDALRAEGKLQVFNDVITSRPYTIEALQQALSFANEEEPGRFLTEPNLMNLMKQAGYKSWWITNQQTMTRRNTLLTQFSRQADEARYLNHQRVQNSRSYDEVVFGPFAEALADPAGKKFIVVHLLGTHMGSARRYPREYEKFIDREAVPSVLSESQVKIYNSYDNGVLYNDFVVSRLIDAFSRNRARGFLVYFSDHGEEVFDEAPHQTRGRNEAAPSRNMYAIPFILHASDEWKKTHAFDFGPILDRKYSNAHFIHTWSDLAGLRYDSFQAELSLVNPDFRAHTRWIGNPALENGLRDFDALLPDRAAMPDAGTDGGERR